VVYSKGSDRGRARFVERSQRPDTDAVLSIVLVARQRASELQAPGLAEQVELAGFGGLRLSEQLGLRADDLRTQSREISINGVWLDPHGEPAHRRPYTKTRENRITPLPPATFTRLQALIPLAKQRKLQRKVLAKQAAAAGDAAFAKWIAAENHAFLFCDPLTLWPWTQEEFNRQWRKTVNLSRDPTKHKLETCTPWPSRVLYRNLRHHCATWWHEELGTPWQQVAIQLGNSYKTVLEHYVLTSEGDRRAALDALAKVELPSLEQLKV
jgi:integrase